jgi:hypothetical protein
MNLVAADVRRLILFPAQEVRASLRRVLRFRAIHELGGVFRECDEHALGHVLSEVRIANHAQRGGIDEIHVTAHQLGKGRFGAVFSVGAQQL